MSNWCRNIVLARRVEIYISKTSRNNNKKSFLCFCLELFFFLKTKSKCHHFECFKGPQKLISHLHLLDKTFPDFPSGKLKVKITQSCLTVCDLMDYTVYGILQTRILELGRLSLLQGIFPTQGLNPDLSHCRQILYQLSRKGSQEYWSG